VKPNQWGLPVCLGLIALSCAALAKEPILVQPSQFDPLTVLHSPPDAEATQAELAELHRSEASRTQAAFETAAAEAKNETVFLFRPVLGDGFTAEKLPVTAAFFAKVGNDESVYAGIAKDHWRRPRPGVVDAELHPCSEGRSFSYPSGHATRAYVLGIVLASILPDKRDAILGRAAEYAHFRIVCEVHYPSDIEAGQAVGTALASVMLSLPAVRQDLEAVRMEMLAAGYTTAQH
jgi:acid phosphatase (class A)